MSLKRSLSFESNNNNNNGIQQLKRLKLYSIVQELQNEEAYLVLLKKLRTSQQLVIQINNRDQKATNVFRSAATPITAPSTKSPQLAITNSHFQRQSSPVATCKPSNSPLLTNSNKSSTSHKIEEYKTQTELALNKQLERDLLNISPPKPSLQDIIFIPNGTSLEFQPFLGLEDVIQCLNELQNNRHRLPQRFTDRAHINEPYVCGNCGTDFTIRWWKHIYPKLSNQIVTILCDRCKKQTTRKKSKSEHSTLLKNVFFLAMEREKEIDKHLNALIKHRKASSGSISSLTSPLSKSSISNTRSVQSTVPTTRNIASTNHQHQTAKTKNSLTQNFTSKLSQQSGSRMNSNQKINLMSQSYSNSLSVKHEKHSRTVQHNKLSIPSHYQRQYRSVSGSSQQTKTNQILKMPKTAMKRQPVIPPFRSINSDIMNSFLSSNLVNSRANKR